MPTRLVVASSMSIYGEGEYVCEEHGRVAPGPRPEEQLLARAWETACPSCGRELRPVGTSETKPLIPTSIYAINKRDHEEMCLVTGAAYGIADGRAALLQRLRPRPGAVEPVHRRGGDLRLASAQRPPARDLRGRRAVARLHARLGHRPGHPARARVRGRRRPGGQPRHRARRRRWPRSPTSSRRAWASTSSPSATSSTARATSATASPTPRERASCSASRRRRASRTAWASWSTGCRTRRPSIASRTPTKELAARGLTR